MLTRLIFAVSLLATTIASAAEFNLDAMVEECIQFSGASQCLGALENIQSKSWRAMVQTRYVVTLLVKGHSDEADRVRAARDAAFKSIENDWDILYKHFPSVYHAAEKPIARQ